MTPAGSRANDGGLCAVEFGWGFMFTTESSVSDARHRQDMVLCIREGWQRAGRLPKKNIRKK